MQVEKAKAAELEARIAVLQAGPRVQEKLTAVAKRREQKREMQDRLDMWQSQLSHAERMQVQCPPEESPRRRSVLLLLRAVHILEAKLSCAEQIDC